MLLEEIIEGVVQVFSRNKGSVVRKYRCTSGTRKGRVVSKPSTCMAPINVKSRVTMKTNRSRKGSLSSFRANRSKKTNPASQRVRRLNTTRRAVRPNRRSRKRRRI
jgi:uncharacterized membrane protein